LISVVQSVSASSQCVHPCKCPKGPPRCKTSYTIKDGCGCCRICPRQQGDLCDHRDKCDEDRGLHCDFSLDDGHRGICRGLTYTALDVSSDVVFEQLTRLEIYPEANFYRPQPWFDLRLYTVFPKCPLE